MTTNIIDTVEACIDIDPEKQDAEERSRKRIAVIVEAVRLSPEEPGLDRGEYVAATLATAGYQVDLITSTFQHWQKQHRSKPWEKQYQDRPYNVVFLEEPGYSKNLDLKRIKSHKVFASNLESYLNASGNKYDLIWCQIPPNNVAATAGKYAVAHNKPFIVDVNDLWPQAMRMAVDIPIVSDIAFSGFDRDARRAYEAATAIVGTSDEYALVPSQYIGNNYRRETVFVGGDIGVFDQGADTYAKDIEKPDGEVWFMYAGTLGKSYDIETLIKASSLAAEKGKELFPNGITLRTKILGGGPDQQHLEELVANTNAPVDFLGYMEYKEMAGYLRRGDVMVNSLVSGAPQSIVSKISDYLASGHPIINTGESLEMQNLVIENRCGINVVPGDVEKLANKMVMFTQQQDLRTMWGNNARALAVERFDRPIEYRKVTRLVDEIVCR